MMNIPMMSIFLWVRSSLVYGPTPWIFPLSCTWLTLERGGACHGKEMDMIPVARILPVSSSTLTCTTISSWIPIDRVGLCKYGSSRRTGTSTANCQQSHGSALRLADPIRHPSARVHPRTWQPIGYRRTVTTLFKFLRRTLHWRAHALGISGLYFATYRISLNLLSAVRFTCAVLFIKYHW